MLGGILVLLRVGISQPILYVLLAVGFWAAILRSGIHATIAGVILGFVVPTTATFSLNEFQEMGSDMVTRFREALASGDTKAAKNLLGRFEVLVQQTESAAERLTRRLNDWVSFLVLPLFALANAGVTFSGSIARDLLTGRIAWGILIGLVLGKPLGILGFSKLAVSCRLAQLPNAVSWRQVGAVGMLAGIGFTVSIFISSLAFENDSLVAQAKAAVLAASLISGVLGFMALREQPKDQ